MNIFILRMILIFRLFIVIILILPEMVLAQSSKMGSLKGTLKDSTIELKGASISVLNAKDSSLIKNGMSNARGYLKYQAEPPWHL